MNLDNKDFIESMASQVEPHVNHIMDYFIEQNLDGKLGEMVLMWVLAMSISVRSLQFADVLIAVNSAEDIVKNLALLFHAIKKQEEQEGK